MYPGTFPANVTNLLQRTFVNSVNKMIYERHLKVVDERHGNVRKKSVAKRLENVTRTFDNNVRRTFPVDVRRTYICELR